MTCLGSFGWCLCWIIFPVEYRARMWMPISFVFNVLPRFPQLLVAHIYVSQSQEKSTGFLGALRRARNCSDQDLPLRNGASRPMIPASSRTTHPFAV